MPGAPRTNPAALGGEWVVASATRRVAQFAATPRGGLQLVGARCTHRWRRTFRDEAVLVWLEEPRRPDACPRVARNTPLARRELRFLPGVRPHKVRLYGAAPAHCPPRASRPRLFREATQRKTVGAAVRVAGIEVLRVETQVHPIAAADRRRIAEPAVADATRPARRGGAVTRGGPTGRSTGSLYPNSASPIPRGNATENRRPGPSCGWG